MVSPKKRVKQKQEIGKVDDWLKTPENQERRKNKTKEDTKSRYISASEICIFVFSPEIEQKSEVIRRFQTVIEKVLIFQRGLGQVKSNIKLKSRGG